MSSNYFEKNLTFHASENDVEASIEDTNLLTEARQAAGTAVAKQMTDPTGLVESEVHFTYIGNEPVEGWSLGGSGSGGGVSRFFVSSQAKLKSTSSRTKTEQGYYRVNPPSGS